MNEPIIGIDLGTTNSEVAVFEDGRARLIRDAAGRAIIPSVVGIDDQGRLLVGEAAMNQYVARPEATIRSIKRKMGRAEKVSLGGTDYSPQEISAFILRHLKDMARADLGREVTKAVITVPAYFSDAQRQATREAGEIAGLEVVRMINEPTAAALAYEAGHSGQRHILVFDLGGGTFDVSVVRMEDEIVEVVASTGNNHLGGDDFDNRIGQYILDHLAGECQFEVVPGTSPHARILRRAESSKRSLSDHPFVRVEEEFLGTRDGIPLHLDLELSRNDYEAMISSHVDETLDLVHKALDDAHLGPGGIQEILLVGGATRTPVIRKRLEEVFGMVPRGEVDPDVCVALGAAIQGAIIGGATGTAVLVDVTPYTFGTSALGELDGVWTPFLYVPLIRRNTPIPTSKSEVFFTVHDNQKEVDVRIFQGEHSDASYNIEIGQFMVEGLSEVKEGSPIVLRLDLDVNGVLHVTATEKNTGLNKKITINNALTRKGENALDLAKGRVAAMFEGISGGSSPGVAEGGDDSGGDHTETATARAVVEKARGLLGEATDEDRDDMVNLIESIQEALDRKEFREVKSLREQLADILFYMET
ncbi:MAG: Hsp70 family protein [Magnetococcales bacterium]|nr:Hsp70 family protein [Magnetococcales bacterium]